MKNKRLPNLRLYFIFYVFAFLCVTAAAAGGGAWVIDRLTGEGETLATVLWMLLLSVVLGTAINAVLSRFILAPITRLGEGIARVAQGDYSVRLTNTLRMGEMRDTYDNFNRMAHALGTTETLQSDFISNVSHEIKTPITAIEGYAMLLGDSQQRPEEQLECIDKILYNTRRLSALVGNILLLSRLDNQAAPLPRAPYRLDEQLRQAVLALEHKWSRKEIELEVDLDSVVFNANEGLMMHVWTNLIDNAVKYSPPGDAVLIRMRQGEGGVVVTVQDNGPGIPLAAQARVFERFYQADSSHQSEGSGLGLPLARRIARLYGGDITVDSREGQGSIFTVTLPVNAENPPFC